MINWFNAALLSVIFVAVHSQRLDEERCLQQAVKVEERVVNSELVKDCEFSDPCQFRSIHDYQRDVINLKVSVALEGHCDEEGCRR